MAVADYKVSYCDTMSYDLTQREQRWQGASTQRIADQYRKWAASRQHLFRVKPQGTGQGPGRYCIDGSYCPTSLHSFRPSTTIRPASCSTSRMDSSRPPGLDGRFSDSPYPPRQADCCPLDAGSENPALSQGEFPGPHAWRTLLHASRLWGNCCESVIKWIAIRTLPFGGLPNRREGPRLQVFHVKRPYTIWRLLSSSATRFCRSLGDTPGIRLACPNVVGRILASFSRPSKEIAWRLP